MSVDQRRLGPFVLEERLGEGGMGAVYRAIHVETRRPFAVKVLSPKAAGNKRIVARFARELEILKALKHPHIVRCFGGGRQGKDVYLVMELITGGSLAALVRRRGRLPWEAVIDYGLQICDGLAYAHEWSIVHRDLTPANLLLTEDGQVKIADFGIARVQFGKRITAAKHTLGTVAYMAPEQIRGEPPVSHRTDLYTLGCVFFEMLTGKLPFDSESTAQMLFQHIEQPSPRVSSLVLDCPVWLDGLVGQLLEKDPLKRPHDAAAVSRALTEARQNAASGTGVVGQTVAGGPSQLRINQQQTEVKEVRELVGRKKKKKKKQTPIYERVWFLVAGLLVVVGALAWALWPAGEDQLFARAEKLMQSDRQIDHTAAEETFRTLLEKYPHTAHAAEARDYIDQVEMGKAERRLSARARRGSPPESEGERLYADAWRFEQFGDRVTALEKYQGIIQLLSPEDKQLDLDDKDRPFVNLARRQIKQLLGQEQTLPEDRLALVDARLNDADQLEAEGQRMQARKIWSSIVALYGDNRELQPQVERAQALLSGDAAPPDMANDAEPDDSEPPE
jgi:eukaryotic-like serine/threonine-protein kinase